MAGVGEMTQKAWPVRMDGELQESALNMLYWTAQKKSEVEDELWRARVALEEKANGGPFPPRPGGLPVEGSMLHREPYSPPVKPGHAAPPVAKPHARRGRKGGG